MKKISVLLVEDEHDFGFILKQYLEMSGFVVSWFQNPLEVLQKEVLTVQYDAAILDVMMPNMDGFTFAKRLKELVSIPFLFLTAKNQQMDRILGLKIGADDYVAKPCDPEELILRLQNILKRRVLECKIIQHAIGIYLFEPKKLLLTLNMDERYQLTEREADLLLFLLEHNNQVVTRDVILHNVWKSVDYFTGRSMDVFISRIRKYLKHDPRIKILSIRGVGFHVSFPL